MPSWRCSTIWGIWARRSRARFTRENLPQVRLRARPLARHPAEGVSLIRSTGHAPLAANWVLAGGQRREPSGSSALRFCRFTAGACCASNWLSGWKAPLRAGERACRIGAFLESGASSFCLSCGAWGSFCLEANPAWGCPLSVPGCEFAFLSRPGRQPPAVTAGSILSI